VENDRPVYIYCDEATCGIGSCLLQYDDFGNPYIVAYYSRTTTAAMKKWSPYSLELSAIALTLKAFENVLSGLEIHIMSDNAVCVNINAFKPMNIARKD